MDVSRRNFMKISAMAGAGALVLRGRPAVAAFAQTQALRKFVDPLRLFGPNIPVASAIPRTYFGQAVDYYEITMAQYTDQLHQDLLPTTLWGYGQGPTTGFKHLGGAIVAQRDKPVRVKWTNNLPAVHPLPVDTTVIPAYAIGANNRAAPHLHGGLVPWPSDGGPFHWFDPDGNKGLSVINWLPDPYNGDDLTDDYWYPNTQSARMMWYHDHAVGITRLNAYAGLASGYLLKDSAEATLMSLLGIPPERQIPLVIQDKVFNPDGSLWYPNAYDIQFFGLTPTGLQQPSPSLVPEFWGDTILVNGAAYPYLNVEPRRYRFQLLNACNTRFLSLTLVDTPAKTFPGNGEPLLGSATPSICVIGTEGGFLDPAVAPMGAVFTNALPLVVAPGERVDFIIDFSKLKPGVCQLLYNDAPVPYPGGTPLADFHPLNRKLAVPPAPGYSPNTRTLLQFRVVPLVGTADAPLPKRWSLPPLDPATPPTPTSPPRDLALYETVDAYGRLAQNLGNLSGPMAYEDGVAPVTEILQSGSVEVWRLFNFTADTHPIHFHYFNVRVISRQSIGIGSWKPGTLPSFNGKPIPPEPQEQGWKETVRVNPGECLTLLVDIPPVPAPPGVEVPPSPRLETLGVSNAGEYVWHCHILEHEEHDMMRAMAVQYEKSSG